MLQEILLSLSGIQSPVWNSVKDLSTNGANDQFQQYVSPPEKAMLGTLSTISDLHNKLRSSCESISRSHNSTVCRTVSNTVSVRHLGELRNKILEVEQSILSHDARFVGAYNTVPLSTLVAEFSPWERKLRWLAGVAETIEKKHDGTTCTSAELLEVLDRRRYTGYSDIENMASELLIAGQKAWIQSVMPWIIYGRLPSCGIEDFMIQASNTFDGEVVLVKSLTPKFVTAEAADTILTIGRSLIQLRSSDLRTASVPTAATSKVSLYSLNQLKALAYPLQPAVLEKGLFAINEFISQNALSQLLPINHIMEILVMFRKYIFLGSGEFATSLIRHAQDRINGKNSRQHADRPVRRLGQSEDITMTDIELSSILSTTWSEMGDLQAKTETEDPAFLKARSLLKLKAIGDSQDLLSTLLPVPAALDIELPSNDPINLFLADPDRALVHSINAFLFSIRRAEMSLSNMWKLTSHRRFHPAPLGPPMSTKPRGQELLKLQRRRGNSRTTLMRCHWATASKALFVFAELGSYFHEEVIEESWHHFQDWLHMLSNRLSPSTTSSRPPTASSVPGAEQFPTSTPEQTEQGGTSVNMRNDPRTIAKAHRLYLENIKSGLLLLQKPFVGTLKGLLRIIDHYVALFERLQVVWEGLDLQEDEGVLDAFSNYVQDEQEIIREMGRTRSLIEVSLLELVENVKTVERERGIADMTTGFAGVGLSNHRGEFVPLKMRTLDRLIMKLDFLAAGRQDDNEDGQDLISGS